MPLIKSFADGAISVLTAVTVVALSCFGLGGVLMAMYWASAFDHALARYLPFVTILGLLWAIALGLVAGIIVFRRVHGSRAAQPHRNPATSL